MEDTPQRATAGNSPPASEGVFSSPYIAVSFAIILTSTLSAFEGLSVFAALPPIGADLGGVRALPWVVTGYLLSSGLAIAVAGPSVDGLGTRTMFRLSALGFALASVLCALAPTVPLLVAARILQGAAGGAVTTASTTAIGLVYPVALRSRVYALAATVWGVVAFGGPAIAGWILTFLDWRFLFWINLPLVLLALVVAWRAFPSRLRPLDDQEVREAESFDLLGTIYLTILVAALLYAVSELSARGLAVMLVAVVFGCLFWRHTRGPRAVMRFEHYGAPPFRGLALVAGGLMGAGMGVEAYLPLYLRGGRGTSVATGAWSVLFLALGWTIGANISSRLYESISEARCAFWGGVLMLPAVALSAASVHLQLGLWTLFLAFFAMGLAIGVATNACLTLVQKLAAPEVLGRVTSAHQFARTLATSLGAGFCGAVLIEVAARRSGDEAAVRQALAEEGVAIAGGARAGIGEGFLVVHALAVVPTVVALYAAWHLSRRLAVD